MMNRSFYDLKKDIMQTMKVNEEGAAVLYNRAIRELTKYNKTSTPIIHKMTVKEPEMISWLEKDFDPNPRAAFACEHPDFQKFHPELVLFFKIAWDHAQRRVNSNAKQSKSKPIKGFPR